MTTHTVKVNGKEYKYNKKYKKKKYIPVMKIVKIERVCLKCDSTFQSSGNRICDECKRSDNYSDCQEDYRIGV